MAFCRGSPGRRSLPGWPTCVIPPPLYCKNKCSSLMIMHEFIHETYTVNVCFWRLGWLSDIRVSNKMILLRHRVWEEGAGLLRGGSGGFLPGGSFGCCSFPVELCLPVRLWNPINLLSSLLRSIPRLWLLQYH